MILAGSSEDMYTEKKYSKHVVNRLHQIISSELHMKFSCLIIGTPPRKSYQKNLNIKSCVVQ